MCMTGNGTTFALGDAAGNTAPAAIGRLVKSLGRGDPITVIDDDDAASTGPMKKCAGDTSENPVQDYEMVFDPDIHEGDLVPLKGVTLMGTHTYPVPEGRTTPASKTGTGFIVDVEVMEQSNNERTIAKLSWQWNNNQTPIAFTKSVA